MSNASMPSMSASSPRPSKSLRLWWRQPQHWPHRERPVFNPINPLTPEPSLPRPASRRCIDRSDRQLVNSGFPDEAAITPNPGNEWSPTERFVSGPAQHPRATRPFVDVQFVVCRTAPSPPSTPRSQDSFNQPPIPTAKQPALNGNPRNTNSVLLTRGEVLVERLGRAA